MRREPHVRFCERAVVRFRRATHLVIGCQQERDGKRLLAELRDRLTQFGLSVHEGKTRLVNARDVGFDFLGYHFAAGRRRPRQKSLKKLKDTVRAKTTRTSGNSLPLIIADLNRTLQGWFEYFKHSTHTTFPPLDGWIRRRLRNILRKRSHRKGISRGYDNIRWPNAFSIDLT